MRVGARPVPGQKGMVELMVDGRPVAAVRCCKGSARISEGLVEFKADVAVPLWKEETKTARKTKETGE